MQSGELKISVVIPAYNAAKTVEKTMRNVLASTIPVHVYVVDDGSVDGTAEILDRLVRENSWRYELKLDNGGKTSNSAVPLKSPTPTLTVLHQQNCGAYQARLNALKLITTPYFGFVDADDTVEPDMFERMVAACEANDLDCVQCKIWESGRNELELDKGAKNSDTIVPLSSPTPTIKIISGDDLESHKFKYLVNPREACYIWDKVYRNQYDFAAFEPTDRITNFDDMVFNFQFFAKIKRMGFLDEGFYHYATTEGSAVHAFGPRQRHDFLWMVKNHYRLSKALFASTPHPLRPTPFKRFLGHLEWLYINSRSAAISWVRSVIRR